MIRRTRLAILLLMIISTTAVAEVSTFSTIQNTCVIDGTYSTTNFCSDPQLYAGTISGFHAATYIATDFSIPAGDQITSATLHLYDGNHNANGNVAVCLVDNNAWSACSLVWSNQPGGNPPPSSEFNITGIGWYSVDVTALAQEWHDGSSANYGFLVYSGSGVSGYCGFASTRYLDGSYSPYLTVNHGQGFTAPTLDIDQCEVHPASQRGGTIVSVEFRATNPNPYAVEVGLGCSMAPASTGDWIDSTEHDLDVTLPASSSNSYWRDFYIPLSAPYGDYTVWFALRETFGTGSQNWGVMYDEGQKDCFTVLQYPATRCTVPYYGQGLTSWCWAASSAMLLSYYEDYSVQPFEFAAHVGVDDEHGQVMLDVLQVLRDNYDFDGNEPGCSTPGNCGAMTPPRPGSWPLSSAAIRSCSGRSTYGPSPRTDI